MALPETAALDGYVYWSSHNEVSFATSLFDTDGKSIDWEYQQGQTNGHRIRVAQGKPILCKPTELFDSELYMTEVFATTRTVVPGEDTPMKLRSIKRAIFLSESLDWSIVEGIIRSSPTAWCYIHFMPGGKAVKRMREAAFGCRDWEIAAVITARYPDGSTRLMAKCEAWITEAEKKLLPFTKGVYGADLGPADIESGLMSFGNNTRLLANLKRKLDPFNILSCGCPLLGVDPDTQPHQADPRVLNAGIVVVICGRRFAGKD